MRASGRLHWGIRLVIAALLLSAPVASAVPADQSTPGPGDPVGNNWGVNGGNYFNQRYSGLDQITTSNVANLKGGYDEWVAEGLPTETPGESERKSSR